ncbi:hypothetical protein K438DRAFT_1972605 [Mycena galopus ATCC 62051]|nr:hypothetical protein K438DRAFT_1972605 [Mycena galopus ATCC 62051]
MVSIQVTYVFLASFFTSTARALLINRTIESSDSLVRYNCTINRCTATPPVVQWPSWIAVYGFLACGLSDQLFCDGQVDSGPHARIPGVNNMENRGLFYFDNSFSNGAHTLVITGSQIALDSIVYTVDDGHPRTPVGPIVGGVIGSLGLMAVVGTIILIFRRRSESASRRNRPSLAVGGGFDAPSQTSDTAALAAQISVLQGQTAELLRAQRESSGTSVTAMTSTGSLSGCDEARADAFPNGGAAGCAPSENSSELRPFTWGKNISGEVIKTLVPASCAAMHRAHRGPDARTIIAFFKSAEIAVWFISAFNLRAGYLFLERIKYQIDQKKSNFGLIIVRKSPLGYNPSNPSNGRIQVEKQTDFHPSVPSVSPSTIVTGSSPNPVTARV